MLGGLASVGDIGGGICMGHGSACVAPKPNAAWLIQRVHEILSVPELDARHGREANGEGCADPV
jgi:hypothetical protein